MREAISKVVGISTGEYLGLGLKPSESARVNNAITVALEIVTVGMRGLRVATSARVLHLNGIGSKGLNHSIIESSDH
jgi:hypothetical protein